MQTQSKELSFEGQNIFVGLDVHLKSWNASIFTNDLHHKTFNAPPKAQSLSEYLKRNFPYANYFSAYEAGFSGFWAHYQLEALGIKNIVVNPADIPSTQKDKLQKTDRRDSRKIGKSLRAKELEGIYIPSTTMLEDRCLIRVRSSIVRDLTRIRQRIKSMLYFFGIDVPAEFDKGNAHWTKRFILWLKTIKLQQRTGTDSLQLWVRTAEQLRTVLLEVNMKIRMLSKTERMAENYELITSVPGIGITTAMLMLTEIGDIDRFENSDHFASFIGIVPTCRSSGEKESKGAITPRRNNLMRKCLVESSWTAARTDPALSLAFSEYCKRMDSNKAIVKIARKLANRIYFVLKNKKKYELCVT